MEFLPLNMNQETKTNKWILIPIVAIMGYWVVTYLTTYKTPKSFRDSVEILERRPDIINKIDLYESYSYYDNDLPKMEDNPAEFKVSLKGTDATIYLSCVVKKKANSGTWLFTRIEQDSLVKVR